MTRPIVRWCLPLCVLLALASTAIARAAHPVNVYRATLRIEQDRASLKLHADGHTLSHEEALYRNPMDARYTMAAIASSVVLRSERGERIRPCSVDVSKNDDGTHTASVDYPMAEDPGICSIASVPEGPLAQGRRRISLTIVRDGADDRSIELTSGRNHHVFRLDETPLEDPTRFTRSRITVNNSACGRSVIEVDFPAHIARDAMEAEGNSFSMGDDTTLEMYERWARASLRVDAGATILSKADWIDASGNRRTDAASLNPRTLRLRLELTYESHAAAIGWRRFEGGVNACDVFVRAEGTAGETRRAGILNRTTWSLEL